MNSELMAQGKEQEQEIMSILLSSSLYVEMSAAAREQLLRYLVNSYFQPRVGENCRARLKAIRTVTEM